jgi:IclR family acetate operon transcriptional repressor
MLGKRTYNITALQRGLRLLSLFAKAEGPLSATQLAASSGLPSSTLHRFLVNLETSGFLRCDGSGNYHLGIACVALGQAAIGQMDMRALSRPFLSDLNRQTRETVHLTVRHGLSAVYVEKLDSPEPVRIFSRIGASVPLHCTAVGKVILAYMAESEQQNVLDQLDLKRFTPNTVGNLQELRVQLQKVRRNGHALDLEEHETHIRCIAAPVWDHAGVVNISLSVTGPAVRMTVSRLRELAPLVQDAGLKISRELGYAGGAKNHIYAGARNDGEAKEHLSRARAPGKTTGK